MMEGIRKFASTPFGKAVFILVLLTFGAGFWYVGNPLTGGSEWALKVGDVEVSAEAIAEDYRRQLQRMRQLSGDRFNAEQARAMGLPQAVMGQLVNRTLLDLGARDLNLTVSDATVGDLIKSNPNFQNPPGRFDREIYSLALRNSGFHERQYEERVRSDLTREQYIASLQAGVTAPKTMTEAVYRFRNETRVAEVVRIDAAAMTDVGEPDDAALRKFHEEHAEAFTAPEYRKVTAVVLKAADLASEMAVSDEELQAAYDDRIHDFSEPEKRTLRQILFSDETVVQRAAERLNKGADFAAVAKEEAGLDAGALDLGTLTRDELIAELADPVFAVAQGKVTAPIKSALGWHIVEVTAIEPASTRSLADVRDELTKTIAMDKAVDALYDLSTRLEDTLGGGASLEDAAQSLNLKLLKIAALDSLGRDVDGKAVTGMPSELPATAFATDVGSDSLLTDTNDGGYFIVRVDEVTPPRLEPLDAVRARVLEAAMTEKRAAAAKEAAEALAEQVRGGADMATAAADKGFKATTGKPVKRSGEGGGDGWPQQLIASVFSAEQGNTVVVDAGNASFVARVNEVRKADPSADKNGLTAIDDEMTQALRNGMLDELVGALRRRHPVKANPQVINKLFETP